MLLHRSDTNWKLVAANPRARACVQGEAARSSALCYSPLFPKADGKFYNERQKNDGERVPLAHLQRQEFKSKARVISWGPGNRRGAQSAGIRHVRVTLLQEQQLPAHMGQGLGAPRPRQE